ncbi:FAD-binding oxidoreductase [Haladaptatus sp. CMSO5]|uniref:FAD-binding oxidoreductase n=1 Tax=Haladaptatus sp. CMSO5 TaxID=3120514 RepID=UPI002FCE5BEE
MTQTTLVTRSGSTITLPAETVESFRQQLRGPLLAPGEPGFDDAIRIWNGMVEKTPALVVQPTGTADVVAAVNFARENDLLVSVKGGGHNIGGTALADGGLTIDMSNLRGVIVDADRRQVTAQAGCKLGDVDRETQLFGLATPLGFISKTGIAGLTLGGGFGYLTRRFGWAVDNLLEVEIVTADGQVRRANSEENADLFWAIRGAGHNFGIVTSFTYRLHEVGPTVYGGLIAWPAARAEEVLATYRELTATASPELTVFQVLMRAPPAPFVPPEAHGERICAFAVCYTGDLDTVEDALTPIRALGDPVVDMLQPLPYAQLQSSLDDTEPTGHHYYWKTEFASELTPEFQATVAELAAECPIPGGQLVLAHIGGAINDRADDDGAIGNRDVRFVYGAAGMWEPDNPNAAEFRQWVKDAGTRLQSFSTGGNYINFQTAEDGEERVRATYGANYDRLLELKQTYDPDNVFRVNRNIHPQARAERP